MYPYTVPHSSPFHMGQLFIIGYIPALNPKPCWVLVIQETEVLDRNVPVVGLWDARTMSIADYSYKMLARYSNYEKQVLFILTKELEVVVEAVVIVVAGIVAAVVVAGGAGVGGGRIGDART